MKVYWVCTDKNIYQKRKNNIPLGIEVIFDYEFKEHYPLVVESNEINNFALNFLDKKEVVIFFLKNYQPKSYDLATLTFLANKGCPVFFSLEDLIFYLRAVELYNHNNYNGDLFSFFQLLELNKHSEYVSFTSEIIAKHIGIDNKTVKNIAKAALFHDIGKLNIPRSFLYSSQYFSPSSVEREILKLHTLHGVNLIKHIPLDPIEKTIIEDVIKHHHERLDGSGYPFQLKKQEISLACRIVMVADVYIAIRENRPHRSRCDIDIALNYIKAIKESKFDKFVVDIFEKSVYAIEEKLNLKNNIL